MWQAFLPRHVVNRAPGRAAADIRISDKLISDTGGGGGGGGGGSSSSPPARPPARVIQAGARTAGRLSD